MVGIAAQLCGPQLKLYVLQKGSVASINSNQDLPIIEQTMPTIVMVVSSSPSIMELAKNMVMMVASYSQHDQNS